MADRDIHVVLCSDHNYFKYGCVTILSLLESNPGVSVVVHYVGSDIPNDDIENLKSLVIFPTWGAKNLNARYSLPHKTHNWRNVGESEQIYEKERYSF